LSKKIQVLSTTSDLTTAGIFTGILTNMMTTMPLYLSNIMTIGLPALACGSNLVIFGLIALVFSIYGLITSEDIMPNTFFFLGAMFLVKGISEFQLNRKRAGYISFIATSLMFFGSIQGFFYN